MNSISSIPSPAPLRDRFVAAPASPLALDRLDDSRGEDGQLRETFKKVVGQTLFGEAIHSMRKTVRKPAYFHGGQAEEIFQRQLDQLLAEKISEASAESFVDPMFELFTLRRS